MNEKDELMSMEQLRAIAQGKAAVQEMANIAQDTNKALQVKLNTKVAQIIDTDGEIGEKLGSTADKLVDMGIKVQENKVDAEIKKTEKQKNEAEFELAEDQYRAAGLDKTPSRNWQKKMVEVMYDIWFVIIRIICFFTLTPFYIFMNVIKAQSGLLKFIAIVIGVVLLLICLGGLTLWVLNITQNFNLGGLAQ